MSPDYFPDIITIGTVRPVFVKICFNGLTHHSAHPKIGKGHLEPFNVSYLPGKQLFR